MTRRRRDAIPVTEEQITTVLATVGIKPTKINPHGLWGWTSIWVDPREYAVARRALHDAGMNVSGSGHFMLVDWPRHPHRPRGHKPSPRAYAASEIE